MQLVAITWADKAVRRVLHRAWANREQQPSGCGGLDVRSGGECGADGLCVDCGYEEAQRLVEENPYLLAA